MSVTPSQTVGPYFQIGLIHERWGRMSAGEGEWVHIEGAVLDAAGQPVIDALLEIWQPDCRAFGRFATNPASGIFAFDVARPVGLADGQAPHLCVGVFARGLLKRLYTRVYFAGDPANANDPILALVPADRQRTLLAVPDAEKKTHFRFDIRLSGPDETVFFDC